MADPRGVGGALVPLSEAQAGAANTAPTAAPRSVVPQFSPAAASIRASEALELTERFSLDRETQALEREYVAADPLFFREPYTGADVVFPSNVPYEPDACDDRSLF